jgi:hypothetical protein
LVKAGAWQARHAENGHSEIGIGLDRSKVAKKPAPAKTGLAFPVLVKNSAKTQD